MKWKRTKSKDVIDIRGAPQSSGGSSGGLGGLGDILGSAGGMIGGGAGTIIVIVVIALQVFGGSSGLSLPDGLGIGGSPPGADTPAPIPEDQDPQRDLKDFSTYVFEDAQTTWAAVFKRAGEQYEHATLVLYATAVSTDGCGNATSAVGPFYCPADKRVYLDLSFYEDMERQLGAPGDFAWAYVIAHEMGHHVQGEDGTQSAEVSRLEQDNPDDANEYSVRLELQADCYSGVWASTVFEEGALEEGDLDEAFTAAEAVGDDRLQEQAGQDVNIDSFTHGSSEQRRTWFNRGFESSDAASCDTFSPDEV